MITAVHDLESNKYYRPLMLMIAFGLFVLISGCAANSDRGYTNACDLSENANGVSLSNSDIEIVSVFLRSLVEGGHYNWSRSSTSEESDYIVLSCYPPLDIQRLDAIQISHDFKQHEISESLVRNTFERNYREIYKKQSLPVYDVDGLAGVDSVVLEDSKGSPDIFWSRSRFADAHPKAKMWVELYLPGYSDDGKYALVRADVGPSAHGAVATMKLKRTETGWVRVAFDVTFYL